MSLLKFFDWFAVSDKGDVINKVAEDTYLSPSGTVYRRTGTNITGSDGSLYSLLDGSGQDGQLGAGSMAIKTSNGFESGDKF